MNEAFKNLMGFIEKLDREQAAGRTAVCNMCQLTYHISAGHTPEMCLHIKESIKELIERQERFRNAGH